MTMGNPWTSATSLPCYSYPHQARCAPGADPSPATPEPASGEAPLYRAAQLVYITKDRHCTGDSTNTRQKSWLVQAGQAEQ